MLVATALTACGIETCPVRLLRLATLLLQRRLPLAVLKLCLRIILPIVPRHVATALTACGIETYKYTPDGPPGRVVATALTACGIETDTDCYDTFFKCR